MIKKFYEAVGGRSMTYAWICLGLGTGLAFAGKLTTEYVGLCSLLAGIVAYRAVKQDSPNQPAVK